MKKYNSQRKNQNDFFPGDSEEYNIEGPVDSMDEPSKKNKYITSKDYNKYNNNNVSNTKYNFQDSEEDYGDISNTNKFKDSYRPKKREINNDEDDELTEMLNQTKAKQKGNKLKEKSIILSQSNFQSSNDKKDNNSFIYKEKSIKTINNDRYNDINNNNSSIFKNKNSNDISNNLDTVNFLNMKSGLTNTYRTNFDNDLNEVNNNLDSSRYKVPKKKEGLTKEEIEQNAKINFNNYADDIIESFFDKNKADSPNFFFDLANEMQNGQRQINYKLQKMIEDDEVNNSRLNQKKQEYINKLENIKKKNALFEGKVNNLNELYCEKLSYISLISKNLFEYEKFHKNIEFSCKLFEYIEVLNSTNNYNTLELPKCLTDTDLIIDEGIEIYLAFKEILSTCKGKDEYENFVRNFQILEEKIKGTIKYSLAKNYQENNLDKLRHIFSITEIMRNDLIINLYVDYIVEDVMKLKEQKEMMKKVQFKEDGISEDLFTLIFKQADDFHETIITNSDTQFGKEYSKIYILFPESQHKIVCSIMINSFIKYLTEFRTTFISERNKNEETYVRIVQYIYPKTISFNSQMKNIVQFTKTDLDGALDQETNIFLRTVEGIYMNKEKNLLEFFITSSYNNLLNVVKKQKTEFSETKNGKLKGEKLNEFILKHLDDLYSTIQSTNFSKLNEKAQKTITRYNILIKSKSEKQDLTETFCKEVFDSIQELLIEYCDAYKLILEESMKRNQNVIDKHFIILSKIDYYKSQFKQIFISELKDFFKQINFYDAVEDYIVKCIYQIDIHKDSVFSVLNSFISVEYTKILNEIRYKDTYKKTKLAVERTNSEEGQKITDFLRKIFEYTKSYWTYLEKYQNMLYLVFTNTTTEKMKDILRNAKINAEGANTIKNDFHKIAATFAEYTEDIYYKDVYNIVFLTELLSSSDSELADLVPKMEREGKVDSDLINIVVKKRNKILS